MYALQMLNSNNEWELCIYLFESYAEAEQYYHDCFSDFDDYEITEMQKRG